MQRYFIKNTQIHESSVTITDPNDIHHMRNVMRMASGTEIVCTDESAQAYRCQITAITETEIKAIIEERLNDHTEMPVDVTIFQGLSKKNKLELVIQKGTELGCSEFNFFPAVRSIVKWDKAKKDQNRTRFEKIAEEASEQSGRRKIPVIETNHSLEELLINKDRYDILFFAYEDEAKSANYHSIARALNTMESGMRIGIFIGPEGGFSDGEVTLFKQHEIDSVRLGPRILRTETAPVYALACISYHFEEMECPSCRQ